MIREFLSGSNIMEAEYIFYSITSAHAAARKPFETFLALGKI